MTDSQTASQGLTHYGYHSVGILGAGKLATVNGPLENDVIGYSYDELGRNAGQAINGVGSTPHGVKGSELTIDTGEMIGTLGDVPRPLRIQYDRAIYYIMSWRDRIAKRLRMGNASYVSNLLKLCR